MRHVNNEIGGQRRLWSGGIPFAHCPRAQGSTAFRGETWLISAGSRIGAVATCALVLGFAAHGPALAIDNLVVEAREYFEAVPIIPPGLKNDNATEARVDLGNMLFHEPRLSSSWRVSCSSCHNLSTGGVDLEQTSVGHGWHLGPRNAPTVLNAVFNIDQFWDGRAKDLVAQAKGPPENPGEMNNTRERIVATLASMPDYVRRFEAAFPGQGNPVNFHNMAQAIATFEATLITPNSRFDQYLRSGRNNTMSPQEREGLALFIDTGCAECHNGVAVGGGGYAKFGIVDSPDEEILPPEDTGRSAVTGNVDDKFVYKIPTLRNIALTPPYFHSGTVWDLKQAIAVMAEVQLGAELSGSEIDAIAAFLGALSGDQPQIRVPTLPPVGETTLHPETATDFVPSHSVPVVTVSAGASAGEGAARVTFPADYKDTFSHFMTSQRWDNNQVRELFASASAMAGAAEGGALPDGAQLAMEVYAAEVDDEDEPILDGDGNLQAAALKLIAIMEKGAGWGDDYPPSLRNGDWEYAFFTTEGELMADVDTSACRECHLPYADEDFVIHRDQLDETAE